MRYTRLPIALLLMLPVFAMATQGCGAVVRPGSRVRVSVRTAGAVERHTGTLRAQSRDTLYLAVGDSTVAVSRASVTSLERRQRTRAGAPRAVCVTAGFLVGSITGAVHARQSHACQNHQDACAANGIGEAALGGVLGLLVGLAIPGERWKSVPLSPHVGVAPGPRRTVPAVLSFPF
jgi:hypothetical protein